MRYTSTVKVLPEMPPDLLCLSHLRWGFVYQRPQHLLSRFARKQRVFFVEEPVDTDGKPRMDVRQCPDSGVLIAVPQVPEKLGLATRETILKLLLSNLLQENDVSDYALWYYTPMAIAFSRHLEPRLTVFDCMDELSAFAGAPQEMRDREAELLRRADVVFTGGQSLYEAKRNRHEHVQCMPSSIEFDHFAQSRNIKAEMPDQGGIPHPRIGFCGVIDERLDIDLLRSVAQRRPDWYFIMIGPVLKIDAAALPRLSNIHYLGGKSYKELPGYMAGWDVAMLPFAHNQSTRFISPTKTPEYLAAGLPVVSTSITDVVRPYGVQKLVRIADTPEQFVDAIEAAMANETQDAEWRIRVDRLLAQNSWDLTFQRMWNLMDERLLAKEMEPIKGVAAVEQLHISALGD
jgi:UDP-galactopyranose mutase